MRKKREKKIFWRYSKKQRWTKEKKIKRVNTRKYIVTIVCTLKNY